MFLIKFCITWYILRLFIGDFGYAVIDPNVRAGMEVGMYSCEKSIRQMWKLNANSSLELFTTAIDTEATDGYMAEVSSLTISNLTISNLIIVCLSVCLCVCLCVCLSLYSSSHKRSSLNHYQLSWVLYVLYALKCIRHSV